MPHLDSLDTLVPGGPRRGRGLALALTGHAPVPVPVAPAAANLAAAARLLLLVAASPAARSLRILGLRRRSGAGGSSGRRRPLALGAGRLLRNGRLQRRLRLLPPLLLVLRLLPPLPLLVVLLRLPATPSARRPLPGGGSLTSPAASAAAPVLCHPDGRGKALGVACRRRRRLRATCLTAAATPLPVPVAVTVPVAIAAPFAALTGIVPRLRPVPIAPPLAVAASAGRPLLLQQLLLAAKVRRPTRRSAGAAWRGALRLLPLLRRPVPVPLPVAVAIATQERTTKGRRGWVGC